MTIYRRGWKWWYLSIGKFQPFKKFAHSGWLCLSPSWAFRYWNY
jgi:hypothetical protein